MERFLWCLGPAILGFVILGIGLAAGWGDDVTISLPLVLFGIGAVISGIVVATTTYAKCSTPRWWNGVGAFLLFVIVAVAYFAATVGGCCAVAAGL